MKIFKNILLPLSLAMSMVLTPFTVFANDNVVSESVEIIETVKLPYSEVNETVEFTDNLTPFNPFLRGASRPSTAHNWSNGPMYMSANTVTTSSLYSNKYFTNFADGKLTVNNNDGYEYARLGVRIMKANDSNHEVMFTTYLDPKTSKSLSLQSFDTSAKYYIEYYCSPTSNSNPKRLIFDAVLARTR